MAARPAAAVVGDRGSCGLEVRAHPRRRFRPALALTKSVGPRAAEEAVVAPPSAEQVAAGASGDAIVARARADQVIAATPLDAVAPGPADDDVGAACADEPVSPAASDDRRGAPGAAGGVVEQHRDLAGEG